MTTKQKHTPGPWKVGEYSSGTEITGQGGRVVCFLAVDRHDEGPAAEESRANASLLASALDRCAENARLREALQRLMDICVAPAYRQACFGDAMLQARAALAKE